MRRQQFGRWGSMLVALLDETVGDPGPVRDLLRILAASGLFRLVEAPVGADPVAAAVTGGANVVVTERPGAVSPTAAIRYQLDAVGPDRFLGQHLELFPSRVLAALRALAAEAEVPAARLIDRLAAAGVPDFAAAVARTPPDRRSPREAATDEPPHHETDARAPRPDRRQLLDLTWLEHNTERRSLIDRRLAPPPGEDDVR